MARKVRMVLMDDSCTTNRPSVEASQETIPTQSPLRSPVDSFVPPPLVSHRWLRGGHLQTLISVKKPARDSARTASALALSQRHRIDLCDGDAMIVHDDVPTDWNPAHGSVLMIHGICGCHAAPYMIRFQRRLNAIGIRTFRLDMRGCGASADLCSSVTHAGRSEDVLAAVEFIGKLVDDPSSPIGGVGVSLGGNQWLLAAGRVGNGHHALPQAWSRVGPILAIAPAMDLQRCSDAMQSPKLRFYNWYFIHHLLKRASTPLRQNPVYQKSLAGPKPKTLRQFDRDFTAPLGGFESESDYYRQSSAVHVVDSIAKPTLIVTAADDPLVPIESFEPVRVIASGEHSPVRLHVTPTGGHHGYLQPGRTSWSDDLVTAFFENAFLKRT